MQNLKTVDDLAANTPIQAKISKKVLQEALAHIQSVVERRNTIPILSNVLIDGLDNTLILKATDMDIAVQESIEAEVISPGSVTVPAHMLYDIVRKLPDGSEVNLEFKEAQKTLLITSGRSHFSLQSLPVADFPVIGEGNFPYSFSLSPLDLKKVIDSTKFAISTEETRYYLNGIFFQIIDNGEAKLLRAVATDGHRLAKMEMPAPVGSEEMPSVIIPRKTITELRKLIDSIENDVVINLSDTRVQFIVNSVILTSKLIDGSFPDTERVIPYDNSKIAKMNRDALTRSADRVSTVSIDKTRGIRLNIENNTVTLLANNSENGLGTESLECEYSGDSLHIGFNARYLLDITTQLDSDEVVFVMEDSDTPTIIREADDDSRTFVLMPMRV